MKYGIYYAYWEKDWGGSFIAYIEKARKLGFDVLEVACGNFHKEPISFFNELRAAAESNGIALSGGYGPRPEHNLASEDQSVVRNAFTFYKDVFRKMRIAGIDRIGGALYSYWPVDFRKEIDKAGDFGRSVERMKLLSDMAADQGISLNMEVLNRFEGYLLNEAYEVREYVRAVGRPNVKAMLDTFHMNIEEDSLVGAIEETGTVLGHFHVGESNRRPPNPGGRIDWTSVGAALRKISYDGYVVLEPFVRMGGQVGRDISIWRDLSRGASDEQLDLDASRSVAFLRKVFSGGGSGAA